MMTLVFLTGCSAGNGGEKFEAWRGDYLAAGEHSITADVTASNGDRAAEYTLEYSETSEGEKIAVVSPEEIAGVSAHIDPGGDKTELCFDGVVLDTGVSTASGLSPMTALPDFEDFIESGHVEYSGRDKDEDADMAVTELETPDSSRMTLWQDAATMEPIKALIRSADAVEITISFTQIQ